MLMPKRVKYRRVFRGKMRGDYKRRSICAIRRIRPASY